jgi:hypothetical protein
MDTSNLKLFLISAAEKVGGWITSSPSAREVNYDVMRNALWGVINADNIREKIGSDFWVPSTYIIYVPEERWRHWDDQRRSKHQLKLKEDLDAEIKRRDYKRESQNLNVIIKSDKKLGRNSCYVRTSLSAYRNDATEGRVMARFHILNGLGSKPVPMQDERVVIGRETTDEDDAPDIGFDCPSRVSRRHATVIFEDGHFFIEDGAINKEGDHKPSRHGTEVNGEKLPAGEKRALKDNDMISLADRSGAEGLNLTFHIELIGADDLAG